MAVWNSPTMTSNILPEPYVTSANNEAGGASFNAMDGGGASYWFANPCGDNPWWKLYVGSAGVCVNLATIKNYSPYGFLTFILQGSPDDINWTDIYSGTCLDNSNIQVYAFPISPLCQYLRFYSVTKKHATYMAIFEFTLAGYDVLPPSNYLHARRDRMNMKGVSTQNSLA